MLQYVILPKASVSPVSYTSYMIEKGSFEAKNGRMRKNVVVLNRKKCLDKSVNYYSSTAVLLYGRKLELRESEIDLNT